MRSRLLAVVVVLLGLPCFAYQLRKDSQGDVVRWPRQVEFVIDSELASILGEGRADAAIRAAVAAMDDATPSFTVSVRVGHAGAIGYQVGSADNQNDVVALDDWPYDENALAATVVTLNARTNEILDADIAFNAEGFQFRVVDALTTAEKRSSCARLDDIQNTVTHELGHALGLQHNEVDPAVVMYPSAGPQEVSKRVLAVDDRDGLLALYDGAAPVPSVESLLGCSSSSSGPMLLAALAVGAALGLRRRRALVLLALAPVAALAGEPARWAVPDLEVAEEVSVADVKARRSFQLQENSRLIVTELELEVRECVKGACSRTRVVRVPGGRVGDIEQVVAHQPVPTVEERILLVRGGRGPRLVRVQGEGDRLELALAFRRARLAVPVSLGPQGSQQPLTGGVQPTGSTR